MSHAIEPFKVGEMEDSELREFVWKHLGNYMALDAERIYVQVDNGTVRLIGRVGEEQERQVAEQVLTDILGIDDVDNQLVIDPVVRLDVDRPGELELADEEEDENNDWAGLLNSDGLDSSEVRQTEDVWGGDGRIHEVDDEDDVMELPDEPRGL